MEKRNSKKSNKSTQKRSTSDRASKRGPVTGKQKPSNQGKKSESVQYFIDKHTPKATQNYVECLINPRGATELTATPSTFVSAKCRIIRGEAKFEASIGVKGFGFVSVDPDRFGNDLIGDLCPIHYSESGFNSDVVEYANSVSQCFTCDYQSGDFVSHGGWQTVATALYIQSTSSSLENRGSVVLCQEDSHTENGLVYKTYGELTKLKNAVVLSVDELKKEHCIWFNHKRQETIDWQGPIDNHLGYAPARMVIAMKGQTGNSFSVEAYSIQAFKGVNVLGDHSQTSDLGVIGRLNHALAERGHNTSASKDLGKVVHGALSKISYSQWETIGRAASGAITGIVSSIRNFLSF